MAFRVVAMAEIASRADGSGIYLIFKKKTGAIVGMWRRQPERDTVLTGMNKSFPGQYGAGGAFCRRAADGELEVAFYPDPLELPECYRNEFEALARAAAPEAKSGI